MAVGLVATVVGLVGLVTERGDGSEAAAPARSSPSLAPPTDAPSTPTPAGSPTGASTPTAGPTDPPSDTPEPETPEAFFARFAEALATGDEGFLLSRLHPFVFERYGRPACRAYLGSLDLPGYGAEVLEVTGTGAWGWETDGLRRRVEDTTTVRIRFTQDGSTFTETDAHVVEDGGLILWFTDCGDPLEGAR